MNQPKLLRLALILQINAFLHAKHTEVLLKTPALAEEGRPSSDGGF